MKTFVIICVMLIGSMRSFAQQTEQPSLTEMHRMQVRMADIETKVESAGSEIQRFRTGYFVGVVAQILGAGLLTWGVIDNANTLPKDRRNETQYLTLGGAALLTGGTISVVVSHRHIGIAGGILRRK